MESGAPPAHRSHRRKLKPWAKGVYQHCGEQHLHRDLVEFDFRYSNRIALRMDDMERAARAVEGAEGKRLTYRQPHKRAHI